MGAGGVLLPTCVFPECFGVAWHGARVVSVGQILHLQYLFTLTSSRLKLLCYTCVVCLQVGANVKVGFALH